MLISIRVKKLSARRGCSQANSVLKYGQKHISGWSRTFRRGPHRIRPRDCPCRPRVCQDSNSSKVGSKNPDQDYPLFHVGERRYSMGHYKSNVRDLAFNLFEGLGLEKALASGDFGDLDAESVRHILDEASRLAEGPLAESFADADRNPPTFDPKTHTVSLPGDVQEVAPGMAAGRLVAYRPRRKHRRCDGARDARVGSIRACAGGSASGIPLSDRTHSRGHPVQHGQRATAALGADGHRTQLGGHHGPHRTRRGFRRRRWAHDRDEQPTAPGTSKASSGSSPTATPTTCSRTTAHRLARPRVPDPAPRA